MKSSKNQVRLDWEKLVGFKQAKALRGKPGVKAAMVGLKSGVKAS
jgi:hypothetical protein